MANEGGEWIMKGLSFSSSVSKESVYVTKGAWHHKKSINEFTDS